jgi:YidC/Oxa1 family membrane protein insertase
LVIWHRYVDLIEWCLREITDVTGNFGVAIIVFTILLKTALLPLTVKSIRSTASMQELQPKIKELQKKYGKDRQRLSQETMKLYNEYRINPAAGCLPLLLQIPIFLGLYRAVVHLSDDYGGFLWMTDLSQPDPYKILPIMAGVFQFMQTRMMRPHNAPKVTDPQQAMMNTMMNFMPLMVVIFGWNFAAGPVLYWATQSVYSVVQQWFITGWGSMKDWMPWLPELPENRRLGHRKEPLQSYASEDGEVAPSGFFGKMQARMVAAEEQRNQRQSQNPPPPPTKKSKSAAAAAEPDNPGGPRVVRARSGSQTESKPADTPVSSGKKAKRTAASTADVQARTEPDIDADGNRAAAPKPAPKRARTPQRSGPGD